MLRKLLVKLPTVLRTRDFARFKPNRPTGRISGGGYVPARTLAQRTTPKTPDLIYLPHVYRWLKTKLQFKYLQKFWDPDFSEGAFIYGTSNAVCRITEIIQEDRPELLEGLMTPEAQIKLRQAMKLKLTKIQKKIIKIKPEDIKILVPMSVALKNKNCKVGMRILALKWVQQERGGLRLVLVALQAEFLKDYQNGNDSDWTISLFDIMDCVILSQVQP